MNCLTPHCPGARSTPDLVAELARDYHAAALRLKATTRPGDYASQAPACLCAMQATELFLNAFLMTKGLQPEVLRSLQHDFSRRCLFAVTAGLKLRQKTQEILNMLDDQRGYLITRHGPEQFSELSDINQLFDTMEEVAAQVEADLHIPAQAS